MTDHDKQRLEFSRSRNTYFPPNEIHETVIIHPSASIGKDGFGFIRLDDGTLEKFRHAGNVIIEKNVEIGALTCIDRAAEGSTVIGEGTKLDNLVHIAHGAKIGKYCLIVAGAVIGGSAEIGDYTFVGINASIKNKVKVGKNCTIGMGAVVTKDVPDGWIMVGNPAKPIDVDFKSLPTDYKYAVISRNGFYSPAARTSRNEWTIFADSGDFPRQCQTQQEAVEFFSAMPLGPWTRIGLHLFANLKK